MILNHLCCLLFSLESFCTCAGYNPLLVLNRVDLVNRSIRTGASTSYPDLEQLRQKAANILNIETNKVLLNVNYIDEEKRSFAIDRITFKILQRALRTLELSMPLSDRLSTFLNTDVLSDLRQLDDKERELASRNQTSHLRLQQQATELQLAQRKVAELSQELERTQNSTKSLTKELREAKTKIEQQEARHLCGICFERPRDAIVLPCTHFLYCNQCLSENTKNSKKCPACRSALSGVLLCKLDV
jgi:E3 ubiquitin-protein ligase BRE1